MDCGLIVSARKKDNVEVKKMDTVAGVARFATHCGKGRKHNVYRKQRSRSFFA